MTSPTLQSPSGAAKPRSEIYTGSCHCGLIQFSMKHSPPITADYPVTKCNCSICHINGYLMVYPLESNITWISGRESLKEYTFGAERISHSFCPNCGTSIGGKSTDPNFFADNRAVNVRTLKGVDVEGLKFRHVDGKSMTSPGK